MRQALNNISVLIYSDWSIVVIGLQNILQGLGCRKVVTHDDFDQVVSQLTNTSTAFDVLIIDFNGNAPEALQQIDIARRMPQGKRLKIVAFADRQGQELSYLAVGVNHVIKKQADIIELAAVIKTVLMEKEYQKPAPTFSEESGTQNGFKWDKPFSKRESQVVNLLALGLSQVEISKKLKISKTAVFTYKKRALEKAGMNSISELLFSRWK